MGCGRSRRSTPRCRPPAPVVTVGCAAAAKSRLTRSGGRSPDRSGRVVRNRRPRRAPCRPTRCISRSTVQRATGPNRSAMPASRRSRCYTLRGRPGRGPDRGHGRPGRSPPATRLRLSPAPRQVGYSRLSTSTGRPGSRARSAPGRSARPPNRSLWSSMKVITMAGAGRALARRNSKPPKESHWRVSAPASRRDRRRLLAAPCRRHHPRSCWPGALLESAQNPAWRCRRSYWELAADALWGQRPSADSPLLAWSPSNAGSPHLRHRSAISRAVR